VVLSGLDRNFPLTDFLMTIFAHARVKFYFEFGNEGTCVW